MTARNSLKHLFGSAAREVEVSRVSLPSAGESTGRRALLDTARVLAATTFPATIAVAAAEMRQARRSVRTWLAGALTAGTGLALYHFWSYAHTGFGAIPAPRFALPGVGCLSLWVALGGLVFLAFDLRTRDEQEQMWEAIDSRPVANLVFLAGRLLAVVVASWLPLLLMGVVLQAGGAIVAANEWRMGVAAEPVSLATFLFLDAPSALLFWGALVLLLASALRSRLVVATAALGLLALHAWLALSTPLYLLPAVSGIANLGLPGSDILPRGPSASDLVQRGGVVLLAAGLLVFASGLAPRRDRSSRTPLLVAGAATALLGVGGVALAVGEAISARGERLAWAEAHAAVAGEPTPDLKRMSGSVFIDPGRELAISVALDVRTPGGAALGELRFSLNPGMKVSSVHLDGSDAAFHHELGLLTVGPLEPLLPGVEAVLVVEARGVPDPRFGHMDSAFDALDESLLGSPAVVMGDRASVFDRRYVALMPAVRWLPMPGANRDTGPYATAPSDLHRIDLEVRVPDGWHLAGSGRVQGDVGRFRPVGALADFALIAAPFERRTRTVDGIELELLIHPAHVASADHFVAGENADRFEGYVRQRMLSFGELPYPHDLLTIVEVPGQLRRYGGGWLMDAVQAVPGIRMLPEHAFPTRRFAAQMRYPGTSDADHFLQQLFLSEMRGLNGIPLSAGLGRDVLTLPVSIAGDGAQAVTALLDFLSAGLYGSEDVIVPVRWLRNGQRPDESLALRILSRLMGTVTTRSIWSPGLPMEVRDRSDAIAFVDVDPVATLDATDILVHKGRWVARAVAEVMGRRKTGEFIDRLVARHSGRELRLQDLVRRMSEIDAALAAYVDHMMRSAALPGFVVSGARAFRLPDDGDRPRYQILVHVRNDEAAPGVVSMNWAAGREADWGRGFHVPGRTSVELGLVAWEPPVELNLDTYLSLNRQRIRLPLPAVDAETVTVAEPFIGARPSDWLPPDPGIVVDDLDPGFSLVWPTADTGRVRNPTHAAGSVPEFEHFAPATGWRRQEDQWAASWGRYRRTLVRIPAGAGHGSASFVTNLPATGRWRLGYHLPGPRATHGVPFGNPPDRLGELHLEVVAGTIRTPVEFDATSAEPGWNDVGTFELPGGPVAVVVSDATDGDIVVADAVRWQSAERKSQGVAETSP